MKYYFGLSCTGHDNAIAIVDENGQIIFAEAAERYLQNKRAWGSPPDDFIRVKNLLDEYCEPGAEIILARSWTEKTQPLLAQELNNVRKKYRQLTRKHKTKGFVRMTEMSKFLQRFIGHAASFAGVHFEFVASMHNYPIKNLRFNHHLTHAANSCFTSEFNKAACMIVDGVGEGQSISYYLYEKGVIKHIHSSKYDGDFFSLSLGGYYAFLTEICGFDSFKGEEWKVMGLAPYGKPNETFLKLLRARYAVENLDLIMKETGHEAYLDMLTYIKKEEDSYEEIIDIAHTGQLFFSEIMTQLLNNFSKHVDTANLTLGGGVALNSAFNGKIVERTSFKKVFIPSAPGDDGNALGAALLAYAKDQGDKYPLKPQFISPYLGSRISEKSLEYFLRYSNMKVRHLPDTICQETAQLIAAGKIVAWVQGRAEFGSRALGNRSILADPRDLAMKDRINAVVKYREGFRPFAPSILAEDAADYFHNYQETPYMERTLVFKEDKKSEVPAVVHQDNTGRLQTVRKDWNPRYHSLISEFKKLTGTPIVLNTSLNIMGKPIVHTLEDALGVFLTSGLDVLVINSYLIKK